MITPSQKRKRLSSLLRKQAVLVPGAYDALTALLIEDNGFDAGYITGAGLSVGLLGKPDVGLLTLNDVTTVTERVASVTSIPFLVDADTGFGDATNVAETVRRLEDAGASGIQLEDQEFPKRCGHLAGKRVVPAVEMVAKIRSAVSARRDRNFLIIARTDARSVTGLVDALTRAKLYKRAGADVIFPEALESKQEFRLFALQKGLGVLMANMTEFGRSPALTFQELSRLGYRLVLYPMTLFRAAAFEGNRVLQHLKRKGETRSLLKRLQTRTELYRLIRYAEFDERAGRALREATKILKKDSMIETKIALPDGYKPGLEGVIAGTSSISEVDAQKDALSYRGYTAHELAAKASYEEVSYLLLYGKLPTQPELSAYKSQLRTDRVLSPSVLKALAQLPRKAHPMRLLAAAVSLISMEDPEADSSAPDVNLRKAIRLTAKAPVVVAAIARLKQNQEPIAPHASLDHAANFLYMTLGKEADPAVARIFDSSNILYGDHGFNASTFAARVTASTLSDLHSAIISAIGALKGPLHGGANEAAIEMLLKIQGEDVESWLKQALARKEKIMGFGHRVYKNQDSRAPYMKDLAQKMAERVGDKKLFDLSCRLEELIKREKNLFPNVDYHCAVAYYLMGLPIEIYTAIFAMARMPGWTAHVLEQHAANRLIRPECFYTGPRDVPYIPIQDRR